MVSSCQPDQKMGRNDAIRNTWGADAKKAGLDFKLVIGGNPTQLFEDELGCDQPDNYVGLPYKTRWNAIWALSNGYDWMFQCFTDTYISVERMMRELSKLKSPITGNFWFTGQEEDHPCGGSGYWLNKEAMQVIATSPINEEILKQTIYAEDRWASWSLRQKELGWKHSSLYDNESKGGGVKLGNNNVTNHLSKGHKYQPIWQYEERAQELTGVIAPRKDKPIILIGSCERDRKNGYNDAIRNTWAKAWGHLIDYRFVLGQGCINPLPDEIVLNVPDGYFDLPFKTREGHRWALENGYDYIFQCFTDTYIIIPRILKTDFRRYDCTGHLIRHNASPGKRCHCTCDNSTGFYPQGGAGYWLSPKASEVIIKDTPGHPEDYWMSEDLWTGNALRRGGMPEMYHDWRYWACNYPHAGGIFDTCEGDIPAWQSTEVVTVHLSRGCNNYDVSWMYEMHHNVLKNASVDLLKDTQPGSDQYVTRYPNGTQVYYQAKPDNQLPVTRPPRGITSIKPNIRRIGRPGRIPWSR